MPRLPLDRDEIRRNLDAAIERSNQNIAAAFEYPQRRLGRDPNGVTPPGGQVAGLTVPPSWEPPEFSDFMTAHRGFIESDIMLNPGDCHIITDAILRYTTVPLREQNRIILSKGVRNLRHNVSIEFGSFPHGIVISPSILVIILSNLTPDMADYTRYCDYGLAFHVCITIPLAEDTLEGGFSEFNGNESGIFSTSRPLPRSARSGAAAHPTITAAVAAGVAAEIAASAATVAAAGGRWAHHASATTRTRGDRGVLRGGTVGTDTLPASYMAGGEDSHGPVGDIPLPPPFSPPPSLPGQGRSSRPPSPAPMRSRHVTFALPPDHAPHTSAVPPFPTLAGATAAAQSGSCYCGEPRLARSIRDISPIRTADIPAGRDVSCRGCGFTHFCERHAALTWYRYGGEKIVMCPRCSSAIFDRKYKPFLAHLSAL